MHTVISAQAFRQPQLPFATEQLPLYVHRKRFDVHAMVNMCTSKALRFNGKNVKGRNKQF